MKWLLIAASIALAGCAGAVPGNPQGFSGINQGVVEFHEDGTPALIKVTGGKEQGSVSLSGEMADGTTFAYTATDTKAFEGQAVRAAVEQAVIAETGEVLPNLVQAIIDALVGL